MDLITVEYQNILFRGGLPPGYLCMAQGSPANSPLLQFPSSRVPRNSTQAVRIEIALCGVDLSQKFNNHHPEFPSPVQRVHSIFQFPTLHEHTKYSSGISHHAQAPRYNSGISHHTSSPAALAGLILCPVSSSDMSLALAWMDQQAYPSIIP